MMSASHHPALSELQLLSVNSLNHTQLWRGRWQASATLPAVPVLIKQLQPNPPDWLYHQWLNAYQALTACQPLAITDKHSHDTTSQSYGSPSYGISQLITADLSQDAPYWVLGYYDGVTLSQRLLVTDFDWSQRLSVAIRVCQLVDRIHCLGYLHRDIKPSNILLTHSDKLILLDFGLAQALTELQSATQDSAIHRSTTAGTPAYMSPEQLTGQALTQQSDYYSLGVVLFELFSGTRPFSAHHLHDWALAHCQQLIPLLPNIAQLSAHQQTQLQHIIDSLLAKSTQYRAIALSDIVAELNDFI